MAPPVVTCVNGEAGETGFVAPGVGGGEDCFAQLSRRASQVMMPRGPDRASFQSHPPVWDLLQNNLRVVSWPSILSDTKLALNR